MACQAIWQYVLMTGMWSVRMIKVKRQENFVRVILKMLESLFHAEQCFMWALYPYWLSVLLASGIQTLEVTRLYE